MLDNFFQCSVFVEHIGVKVETIASMLDVERRVVMGEGGRVLTKNSGSKHKKERKHPKKVGESERKGARVCESMLESVRVRERFHVSE